MGLIMMGRDGMVLAAVALLAARSAAEPQAVAYATAQVPYQFSDFGAQAYYRQGFQGGYTHGMSIGSGKGYQAGHHVGLAEGFQAGIPQGMQTGFQKGYTEATPRGYYSGFQNGYVQGMPFGAKKGEKEGFPIGEKYGFNAGYYKGGQEGFAYGEKAAEPVGRSMGFHKGYPSGHHAGFHDGYLKGFHSGELRGESIGHSHGFMTGRQEGLHSGYMAGFQQGLLEGQRAVVPWNHAVQAVHASFPGASLPSVSLPATAQPNLNSAVHWKPLDHVTAGPVAAPGTGPITGSNIPFAITAGTTKAPDANGGMPAPTDAKVVAANTNAPFYTIGGKADLSKDLPPSAQGLVAAAGDKVTHEKPWKPDAALDGPSVTPRPEHLPGVPAQGQVPKEAQTGGTQ